MIHAPIDRRRLLAGGGAIAAALTVPFGRVMAAAAEELRPIPIPPPISSAERLQRIAKARALMQQNGIGSIVVESGPSLDYLTGVQWWRSERLTAAVIPAQGDPIIVTPFFERPSVAESLSIPAEIRTWNEDEEPLKLVADFLRERGVAGEPDRVRGDRPLFHPRPAQAAAAGGARGQRQPGRARVADDQVAEPSSR